MEWTKVARDEFEDFYFECFGKLKNELENFLSQYTDIIYDASNIDKLYNDKFEINRVKRELDSIKWKYRRHNPHKSKRLESEIQSLQKIIMPYLIHLNDLIRQEETPMREEKKTLIYKHYKENSQILCEWDEAIFHSPAFINEKWFKVSCKEKMLIKMIREKIERISKDISIIKALGGNTEALLFVYLERLNLDETCRAYEKMSKLPKNSFGIGAINQNEDTAYGHKILKICGTELQMNQLEKCLEIMNLRFWEIENKMPKQILIKEPLFTSFVSIDTEMTGTYGKDNDDKPSEIMEIGAIKVVDGRLIERRDWLCNPKRKITPEVMRLTSITDEMVRDQPPVTTVVKELLDFAGDLPFVGHSIYNSDLPMLDRAARRAGIVVEWRYLDIFLLAQNFQEKEKWDRLGLDYLTQRMGISMHQAHRACSDAEATAYVYLNLCKLWNDNNE